MSEERLQARATLIVDLIEKWKRVDGTGEMLLKLVTTAIGARNADRSVVDAISDEPTLAATTEGDQALRGIFDRELPTLFELLELCDSFSRRMIVNDSLH